MSVEPVPMVSIDALTDDAHIEAAARALFARDMRRSVGMDSAENVWPRVAPVYRNHARAAIDAIVALELGDPADA